MEITFEGVKYETDVDEDEAYRRGDFVLPDGRVLVAEWNETSPPQIARLVPVSGKKVVVFSEPDSRL